jgi:hypothetical protein
VSREFKKENWKLKKIIIELDDEMKLMKVDNFKKTQERDHKIKLMQNEINLIN